MSEQTAIEMVTPSRPGDGHSLTAYQRLPRSILEMTAEQLTRLKSLSEMLADSQLSYKGSKSAPLKPGDLFIIMLKGLSLGMTEMAALESIDLIGGKPCLDGQGMLALAYNSNELENISIDATDERCVCIIKRRGFEPHTEIFGDAEASVYMTTEWVNGNKVSIPLIQKANYINQKKVMYKWRAITANVRVTFSDKTQGLYNKEELAAHYGMNVLVDDDGRMTITSPTPAPQSQPQLKAGDEKPTDGKPDELTIVLPGWLAAEDGNNKVTLVVQKIMQNFGIKTDTQVRTELKDLLGIEDPKKLDNWAKYETGAKAIEAFTSAFNTREANRKPATTKKNEPAEEAFTWTEEAVRQMDELCELWWDTDLDIPLDASSVLQIDSIGKIGWSEYKDLKVAISMLVNYTEQKHIPFIATSAQYHGKYTLFSNGQINARLYGREKLRELGEEWAAMVDAWEDDKTYPFDDEHHLIITWEDKKTYRGVTEVKVLEHIDFNS